MLGALALCAGLSHADTPRRPSEFAWRAPLELPAGTSVARVSAAGAGAGAIAKQRCPRHAGIQRRRARPSPSPSWLAPRAAGPVATTGAIPALPLYSTARGTRQPTGSTQVRIQEDGQRSVWVHMSGARVPGAPRLEFGPVRDQGGGADAQRARGAGHRAAEHAGGHVGVHQPRSGAVEHASGARPPVSLRGRGRAGQHDAGVRASGQARGAVPAAGLGQPGGRVADRRLRRYRGRRARRRRGCAPNSPHRKPRERARWK